MTFSGSFDLRMRIEQAAVARELPQFEFFQKWNDNCFMGWHTTLTSRRNFQLKLILSKFYPDQMPKLYVTHPRTLWKHGGGTTNSIGVSHAFHTRGNGPDGCVQICHFSDSSWDASKNCVGILFKGILWLEAYDVHLITGMDIATILNKWKKEFKLWERNKKGFDRLLRTWQEETTLGTS